MSSRLPSLSPTHFSLFNQATVQDIPPSARSMPARFLADTTDGLFSTIKQEESAYDTLQIKCPRMTTTDGDLPENVTSAKITPQLFRRNACPDILSHFNLPPNTSCTLCQVNPPQAPVEKKETPVLKPRPKPMISDMPQKGAQLQPRTLVCPPTPRPLKLRTRQELCPFVSAALKIID